MTRTHVLLHLACVMIRGVPNVLGDHHCGQQSPRRQNQNTVRLTLLMALSLTMPAFGCSRGEHEVQGAQVGALTPGWHLVSTSDPGQLKKLRMYSEAEQHIFGIEQRVDAEGQALVHGYRLQTDPEPNSIYWVHVGRLAEDITFAELTPPAWNEGNDEFGQIVQFEVPVASERTRFLAIRSWLAENQRWQNVEAGTMLRPHHPYWVLPLRDRTPAQFDVQYPDNTLALERNRLRAEQLRTSLLRSKIFDSGEEGLYQVEYQPENKLPTFFEPTPQNAESARDAKYLAEFERVWAYTQGIALAQLARRIDDKQATQSARKVARALCERRDLRTGGWPFSWNTRGDNWQDARSVTGANAWALYGLGVFISADAFQEDGIDQAYFRGCYRNALAALMTHRRVIRGENGKTTILMTAGHTTRGLQLADQPAALKTIENGDAVPLTDNERERWTYYSILDAVGYDTFHEDRPPTISRWEVLEGDAIRELEDKVLTQGALDALRERTRATNVVTEHNLDTLSVLNHALNHAEVLGLDELARNDVETWRDQLREGIFELLWDGSDSWRHDLHKTHAKHGHRQDKQRWLEEARGEARLGRFITGGVFLGSQGEQSPQDFVASSHVAIDNCSWLALSVDYKDLTPNSVYDDRLARCLRYTVLQFAKELEYEGGNYYGAHYFQNTFRDPYIDPSALQESSYHLEATSGLILGLLAFATARPEHMWAEDFRDEALTLWNHMQRFVADHGFPYSSRRIQNLSTELASSTAAIWFIDVDETIRALRGDPEHAPLAILGSDPKLAAPWPFSLGIHMSPSFLEISPTEFTSLPFGATVDDQPVFQAEPRCISDDPRVQNPTDPLICSNEPPTWVDVDSLPKTFTMDISAFGVRADDVEFTLVDWDDDGKRQRLELYIRPCLTAPCATPEIDVLTLAQHSAQWMARSTLADLLSPLKSNNPFVDQSRVAFPRKVDVGFAVFGYALLNYYLWVEPSEGTRPLAYNFVLMSIPLGLHALVSGMSPSPSVPFFITIGLVSGVLALGDDILVNDLGYFSKERDGLGRLGLPVIDVNPLPDETFHVVAELPNIEGLAGASLESLQAHFQTQFTQMVLSGSHRRGTKRGL